MVKKILTFVVKEVESLVSIAVKAPGKVLEAVGVIGDEK